MNNQKKTTLGKIQNGTEISNKSLQALITNNPHKFDAKVHSLSEFDFVLSTPFATYKIPRSHFVTLAKASDEELKNVIMFKAQTGRFECGFVFSFYWYDLDDIFDADQFEKFKIDD